MLRLTTLGSLELRDDAGAPLLARRRKPLVLLAYLAWSRDRWFSRSELAALLWGERDESRARNSLRQALFHLHGVVGDGLVIERQRVRLADGTIELDARRFDREARAGDGREALRRWGGEFLPGMEDVGTEAFRTWLDARRASLRGRYLEVLQRLTAHAAERGTWADALELATRWADAAPLDEAAHTALVRALRAMGRGEEAGLRHAAFMERYRAEVGAAPSPAFVSLQSPTPQPGPHSPGSAALFSPDLVGRRDALAGLQRAWQRVRDGGKGIVLVRGEPGIGKTRLCTEFLRWLERESGARVLVLRAQAVNGGHDGLTMASDLLAPLRDAPGLSGASDQALAEVARLLPGIRERYPHLPAAADTPAALRDAVVRVIADVAAELPVVVCVDDLPRAAAESQQLVLSLLRRMPASTLLLATARPDEMRDVPELAAPEQVWGLDVLELGPLDTRNLDALIASMLPMLDPYRKALAERLLTETGGNPFYAVELIRTLVDEGHLAADERGIFGPQASADGSLPLPTSVQDSVVRRIERLQPAARAVLGGAAVLGRFRRPSFLARVLNRPVDVVHRALDGLIARRFLHVSADGTYT
ncbi:MAG TPA: AAA family ATPase, partial [Longimicrobiales bacterium]|nr:AAA family ATPase [Longimicrobiales bacterium]